MLVQCGNSNSSRNNAAAHNNKPRGINLLERYTLDDIYAQIADNSFEDLYIGDYFDITISTPFKEKEDVRCLMGHFNYYIMMGDTPLLTPHAVITIKNCFTTPAKMNETAATEGGYEYSKMSQSVLTEYKNALHEKLNGHLLRRREFEADVVNATTPSMAGAGLTGASSNYSWYNSTVILMSEIQVCGCQICSSSHFEAGIANRQLALFRHDPSALVCKLGGTDDVTGNNRAAWWLRNAASKEAFADVNEYGFIHCGNPAVPRGVRPVFCIG